ncbi:MAG: GDP-L-fucose synthase family protein, partial [Candidatus Neomarinimicrobiota bacterium]
DQAATRDFFTAERPDHVFLAAAKVGGIHANNTYPAEFIQVNLAIQTNVIHEAWRAGVTSLLFLGSSCIYPRDCPQPIKETYLLTGKLEPTNKPYAVAKIAGIEMCWSYNRQYGTHYRAVMPTNLYGPGDNFHLKDSHVMPALIRRFHEAKLAGDESVEIWGTGKPRREFLHVDDLARACIFVLRQEEEVYRAHTTAEAPLVNIGAGKDISIRELATLIRDVAGYEGEIIFDTSKPDGTPQKLLDVSRMTRMGWTASISLKEGLASTYAWFVEHQDQYRR